MECQPIADVLRANTAWLMSIPGVVGIAEGEQDDGTPCILVFVEGNLSDMDAALPTALGGYPVEVSATGSFEVRPDGAV